MAQKEDPLHQEKDFESGIDYSAFQEEEPEEPQDTSVRETSGEPAAPESRTETDADPANEQRTEQAAPADADAEEHKTEAFTSPIYRQLKQERPETPTAAPVQQTAVLDRNRIRTGDAAAAGPTPSWLADTTEAPSEDSERRAAWRDEVRTSASGFAKFLQVLLAIFYPFLLLVGTLRLVASPLLLLVSYNRPGFPADEYGFTAGDRLTYGSYPLDYLYNTADSRYLGDLTLNGQAVFRPEEVQHMADVKLIMVITMLSGLALLILAGLCMWYLRRNYPGAVRRAFFSGAIATLAILVAVAVAVIVGFTAFFNWFHEVFFPQGNWQFYRDDTLIRLYPEMFWLDAIIGWGALVLIGLIITFIATWPTKNRRARSAAELERLWALEAEEKFEASDRDEQARPRAQQEPEETPREQRRRLKQEEKDRKAAAKAAEKQQKAAASKN